MNRRIVLTCILALLSLILGTAGLRAQDLSGTHKVFLPLVSQDGPSVKVACIKQDDGTLDCSQAFIEVGTPPETATLQAPACSGYNCDGKNPYSMGCAVSYGVIDMSYIYDNSGKNIGYVQLWWSNTCQTNWARVVRTSSVSFYQITAWVVRDDNSNRIWNTSDTRFYALGGTATSVYTGMVYAPVRLSLAQGSFDTGGPYTFTGITRWN